MLLEAGGFDTLVGRFERLGKADRQAILAKLDPMVRVHVKAAIDERATSRRDDRATGPRAGRDYAAYSPWLADIVRSAAIGDGERSVVTDQARRTIVDAHLAMTASGDVAADSLMSQVRQFGARLFYNAAPRP